MPTDFAIAHGARVNARETLDGKATCDWWLRTTGCDWFYNAAQVWGSGGVYHAGSTVSDTVICIRPALWVNLES